MQGVFHAGLLLLHVRFGRGANGHNRHAAGQFGEPFLELLAIVIAGGRFDALADLFDPLLHVSIRTGALHQGGGVLGDGDFLRPAQLLSVTFSSLMPKSSLMTCRR